MQDQENDERTQRIVQAVEAAGAALYQVGDLAGLAIRLVETAAENLREQDTELRQHDIGGFARDVMTIGLLLAFTANLTGTCANAMLFAVQDPTTEPKQEAQ